MSFRDFELLTNALENGITVEIEEGNFVSLNSFADICKALKGLTTWNQIFLALLNIAEKLSDPTAPVAISNDLVDCISVTLGIPLPHLHPKDRYLLIGNNIKPIIFLIFNFIT